MIVSLNWLLTNPQAKAREKKKEESILKRDDMIKKYETYIRSIKEVVE